MSRSMSVSMSMTKCRNYVITVFTIVDSMSTKDLVQYVANDMKDFLQYCSESEVVNEFLIKVEHSTDEQFYNKFVKQIKGKINWAL